MSPEGPSGGPQAGPHGPEVWRAVAGLHAAAIDRGFLSSLGPRVLTLIYRAIDAEASGVLLVARRDGRVAGFVAGGPGTGPLLRRLLRRPLALALALAPLLLRPRKLLGLLEILRHGRQAGGGPAGLPGFELLSIAVTPDARGSGLAEALYRGLETEARARGHAGFRITVGEGLAPAHRFYRRMGAEPVGEVAVHGGSRSLLYVQRLSP